MLTVGDGLEAGRRPGPTGLDVQEIGQGAVTLYEGGKDAFSRGRRLDDDCTCTIACAF